MSGFIFLASFACFKLDQEGFLLNFKEWVKKAKTRQSACENYYIDKQFILH